VPEPLDFLLWQAEIGSHFEYCEYGVHRARAIHRAPPTILAGSSSVTSGSAQDRHICGLRSYGLMGGSRPRTFAAVGTLTSCRVDVGRVCWPPSNLQPHDRPCSLCRSCARQGEQISAPWAGRMAMVQWLVEDSN